mgnify:CR=1 FL=1
MLTFLDATRITSLADADPNSSVLEYLRERVGKTGTKEGCASGDCGACTAVTASLEGDKLRYQAINTCITPLGNLHGKQLISVDDLAENATLHPVQQAMVDAHASQCGFCTPGFVMSLFALWKSDEAVDRHAVIDALGGNLCRCTGYRPIIDAALTACAARGEDAFSRCAGETAATLRQIASDTQDICLSGAGRRYLAPTDIQGLVDILAQHPRARLVAGSTDLHLEITQQLREIDVLVYPGRVPELLTMAEEDGMLHIGAAVTYADSEALLCRHFPDLEELLARLGSRQIRNQGTLGGNIGTASPIGDIPPFLLAVDARLRLRSVHGSRDLPVSEFFLDYRRTALQPGECIERILIPLPTQDSLVRAYKISKRLDDDISSLCGVFHLRLENGVVAQARVAFGGMAATPARAPACERALSGKQWTLETAINAGDALAEDFQPIDDLRATATYRLECAAGLLQRLYYDTVDTGIGSVRVFEYA